MNIKRGTRRVAILSGVIVSILVHLTWEDMTGRPRGQNVEVLERVVISFAVGFVPIWSIGWVIRGFQRTRNR